MITRQASTVAVEAPEMPVRMPVGAGTDEAQQAETYKEEDEMDRKQTIYKVTSPSGQVLTACHDTIDNMVALTSQAGNHGSITPDQWQAKLAQMQAAGYTVDTTVNQ